MKKLLLLLALFIGFTASGQEIRNSWIDYTKEYLKVATTKDEVYKVTLEDLAASDLISEFTNLDELQLFHNGHEVAIKTVSDTKTPYFLFLGEKNTGLADSVYFHDQSYLTNPHVNLYSDTTYFFLTLNKSSTNKRIETIESNNIQTSENSVLKSKKIITFSDHYTHSPTSGERPSSRSPILEQGEGYSSKPIKEGEEFVSNIVLNSINKTSSDSITILISFNGRSSKYGNIKYQVNDMPKESIPINYFQEKGIQFTIPNNGEDSLNLKISNEDTGIFAFSINYIEVTYPFNYDSNEASVVEASSGIVTFSEGNTNTIWNISDKSEISQFIINSENSILLNSSNQKLLSWKTENEIKNFEKLKFEMPNTEGVNFLIISNKILEEGAIEYKKYKESIEGGSHKVSLVFVDDLYNQFNYGCYGPYAIKEFINFTLTNTEPEYLLLLGKSYTIYWNKENGIAKDLVPTFNNPPSDLLLSSCTGNNPDYKFGIATGRVPAKTNNEVLIYLDKLKQNDSTPDKISKKMNIHLSGGKSDYEKEAFASTMLKLEEIASNTDFNIETEHIRKTTVDPVQNIDISEEVNNGISIISFLGHSSYESTEIEIGTPQTANSKINNSEYPILIFNGCNYNYYNAIEKSQSASWLFAENKGSILNIGQGNLGYTSNLDKIGTSLYQKMYASNTKDNGTLPLGKSILNIAKELLDFEESSSLQLNIFSTYIFGDPSVQLFKNNKIDLAIEKQKVEVAYSNDSTSLTFMVPIYSVGSNNYNQYTVEITELDKLNSRSKTTTTIDNNQNINTLTYTIKDLKNFSDLVVSVNPDRLLTESNVANNTYQFSETTENNQIDNIKPNITLKKDVINTNQLELQLLINDNYSLLSNKNPIQFYYKNILDSEYTLIEFGEAEGLNSDSATVQFTTVLKDFEPGSYEAIIRYADNKNNVGIKTFTFEIKEEQDYSLTPVIFPMPYSQCFNIKLFSGVNEKLNIEILDLNGKIISSKNEVITIGENNIPYCDSSTAKSRKILKLKSESLKINTIKAIQNF